jgi:octaprenyl-diphosphate synthase
MNVPKPQPNVNVGRATASLTASQDFENRAIELEPSIAESNGSASGPAATGLEPIYRPIAKELAAVEKIIEDQLCKGTPWIDRLLEHNWIRGGKRIRPVMVLLAGGAAGGLNEKHLYLSAAVELIHAATLVHDDVIDNADVRRHLPTINATWGNRTSVLLGDFLFTHAFYVAGLADNLPAIKAIAQSSNRVCEGEIRQNAWQGNFDLTEQDYLEMIADKTGELCSCSCLIGAIASGSESAVCEKFGQYGLNLGVAFQIIDDVLDLVGQPGKVGKTLGTDVSNQKPTLPILHSLRVSSKTHRAELMELLKFQPDNIGKIARHLEMTGSIEYAQHAAKSQLNEAIRFAQGLPPNDFSKSLQSLANFVLNRVH